MVVEELLKLLVDKIDRDLFKAVVFKDFEAGDVENSAKVGLCQCLGKFEIISGHLQVAAHSHDQSGCCCTSQSAT